VDVWECLQNLHFVLILVDRHGMLRNTQTVLNIEMRLKVNRRGFLKTLSVLGSVAVLPIAWFTKEEPKVVINIAANQHPTHYRIYRGACGADLKDFHWVADAEL